MQPLRRLIGDESRARGHNELVNVLGAGCPRASDPWGVCDWVQDPSLRTGDGSGSRRLPLRAADRFVNRPLYPDAENPPPPAEQVAMLLKRARELRPRSLPEVSARLAELGRAGLVLAGSIWTHPRHPQLAFELSVQPESPGPGRPDAALQATVRTGRVLLIVGDTQARLVSLPGGWGQYDDGHVVALSDIDGDLRLEVWFAGQHGECDGEDSKPGVDCDVTRYHFGGEVFGSELSPYRRGHRVKPPQ